MTGYRDIFCILLFICIIHSVDCITAEFCADDYVGFNHLNSSNLLRSPNYQTNAHYNIARDCEINVTVVNIVQPYVVNAVQTSLIDCTEKFRVLDASKNPFTDQTTNCTGSVGLHSRSVHTYFRSGGRQILLVQLPAGYAPRVSVTVSVTSTSPGDTISAMSVTPNTTIAATTTSANTTTAATIATMNVTTNTTIAATTTSANTTTATTIATMNVTTNTTIAAPTTATATMNVTTNPTIAATTIAAATVTAATTIAATAHIRTSSTPATSTTTGTTATNEAEDTTERTTENSATSSNLNVQSTKEVSEEPSKPFLGNKSNRIAIAVGAGGFLLIVIIIVLACMLASRHRNRTRQDKTETIQLATDTTNGFGLMADERNSGVGQVDGSIGAASMSIPAYEYHSVEVDPTVNGKQSTGKEQGRLGTTADRPHIEEEYATINKPFKLVELNDSRQSGNGLAVQHLTGSEVDGMEIYAEAPAMPVYMPGSSGEAGEHDTTEKLKPTKNADDSTDKQVSSENNIVDQSDRVPSQADKQAASGDLAGGEEVHFVDNELYSTGGGDWVGL